MNHQSDYGYAIPVLESRSRAICLQRASFCEKMALEHAEFADKFLSYAEEWREEAKYYTE